MYLLEEIMVHKNLNFAEINLDKSTARLRALVKYILNVIYTVLVVVCIINSAAHYFM